MGKYRKLIAALLGMAVMVALRYYNIEIPGVQPIMIDLIVGGLTSFGVYQAPNERH